MRILMLAQFYPPYLGGEERHVQDLSRELAKRGHEVAVATLWYSGLAEYEVDHGVRIHRIRGSIQRFGWLFSDTSHRHTPPFPDPEAVLELHRVLKREQPEIIHAHNWLIHSVLPLKAFTPAKLVLSLHDYSLVCAKKKLIYQGQPCEGPGIKKCISCSVDHYGPVKGLPTLFANWASGPSERSAVDMFLPVSQATVRGNGLAGSGIPYRIIPNFIPDDLGVKDHQDHPYLKQLPEDDFLLFVGALGRHKGVDVLLDAYREMNSAPPMVLIGYETMEYPVDIDSLPPNVFIYKNWPHEAVLGAWQRCIAGIAPSTCLETFGIVVIEAMSFGRPVIASRIGGLEDLIDDGENGFLVPPGDPSALRSAMERLLMDHSLRKRMAASAHRKAEEFFASAVVPRFEAVYTDLLTQTSRTHSLQPAGSPYKGRGQEYEK